MKEQEKIQLAERYTHEHGVETYPGYWIFGSAIDFEDRKYAPWVDRYFEVACPIPGMGRFTQRMQQRAEEA
jgi:hypothetical protein